MPEDFNSSRKLINVPDEDRSDESDEDNTHVTRRQASTKQKMREIVQNFFNCNKFSAKKSNNETLDTKNKTASLLANLMCSNIKQIRLDDSRYVDSRNNSPTKLNDKSGLIDQKNACQGDEASSLNKNDSIPVKQKTRSWRDVLMTKSKTEVRNNDASNESSSKGNADVLKDNRYERLYGNASGSTSQNTFIRGNSGLEYDRIRQSIVTENERRRSTCNAASCQSAEGNGTKAKVKFGPRLKTFLENNVRKIWKRNLLTGGVVLMNDEHTNVDFTPFNSDVGPIVDTTVTSQTLSAPDLLCGGKVIHEGFADSFKPANYYIENPLVVNLSNDKPISKSSTFIPPPTEPRSFATLSGGNVVDNSSKGVSLPDLFPSQAPALNYHPPVLQHLSWGQLKTHDAENRISLDLTTYSLKMQEINSPELPCLSNRGKFSRVNSETTFTPMNALKSHPNMTDLSPIAHHSQRHCSVSRNNHRSCGIHDPKSQASRNYPNTTHRSSSNNLNCNNAATRMSRDGTVRPVPAARNVTDHSAENVVDQRRNSKSNTNGQKNTSRNPKLHDLRGRSRYL